MVEQQVARYHELKQMQKMLDEELEQLRKQIIAACADTDSMEIGDYSVRITTQERREYDDTLLYEALPDASVWRLLSKADGAKINSLLKLQIINEETLKGTYQVKNVPVIRVQKR